MMPASPQTLRRLSVSSGASAPMRDVRHPPDPDRDGENLMRENLRPHRCRADPVHDCYGDIDQAVRLVRAGARDYLTKPFDLDEVVGGIA